MYDFSTVNFSRGAHKTREHGMCFMEAVAFIAGEKHTDAPDCVDPVLGEMARTWNDQLDDEERSRVLGPFLWRFPGTEAGSEVSLTRGDMMYKCMIHEMAPLALELSGMSDLAASFRSLKLTPESLDHDNSCVSAGFLIVSKRSPLNTKPPSLSAVHAAVRKSDSCKSSATYWCSQVISRSGGGSEEFRNAIEDMAIGLLDRCIKLTEIQEIVRPQEWHCRAKSLEATL